MLNSAAVWFCFYSHLSDTCLAENLMLSSGLEKFLLKQTHAFCCTCMSSVPQTIVMPTRSLWFNKDQFDKVSTFVEFMCLK